MIARNLTYEAVPTAQRSEIARRFARGALTYFIVVGILGTYLRARYVAPLIPQLQFANVLHAHSHVAYFGWASLALIAAIYSLLPGQTGRPLQGVHLVRWQLGLTHAATVGALVTFAAGGYTPLSIVFSTCNLLLWYLFMHIYWLNVRGLTRPLPVALRYWHGAVGLLFVSSLGVWLVSAIMAVGGSNLGQQAGLNLFLTNFTDGWLVLGLMGVVVAWLTPTSGSYAPGAIRAREARRGRGSKPAGGERRSQAAGGERGSIVAHWAAWPWLWIVILTPFMFLAELVMFELPMALLLLGLFARFGLSIPYVWFLLGARTAYRAAGGAAGSETGRAEGVHAFAVAAFLFFAVKAAIHFALGITAIVPSRHMLIAYLHLDLLGFVSSGLLAALYWVFGPRTATGVSATAGRTGSIILSIGVLTMVVSLTVVALVGSSPDPAARSAVNGLLQAAFVFGAIALVGIIVSVAGLWSHTRTDTGNAQRGR